MARVSVGVRRGGRFIAPIGLATPHLVPTGFDVVGAPWRLTFCSATGQAAALIDAEGPFTCLYDAAPGACAYPEAMFHPTESRYTRAADGLVADAAGKSLEEVVAHTASLFTYGHPETRFYEEAETVPQICGLTEGSCVDINLYLIASLRAAGIEAGYMTGYFFPEEKAGTCVDMHCWVVTRRGDEVLEWDVAHHFKMGVREIGPGLNPKPGWRVPMAHSMGLSFPELGLNDMKLIGEPALIEGAAWDMLDRSEIEIRYEDAEPRQAA